MSRFTSFTKKFSRRKITIGIVLSMLILPALITSTVESAQTKTNKKATPTPKKKTTPTPKKNQAKATPTPKKSPSKTAAKIDSKTTPAKKTTSKTTISKTGDKNSKTTAVKNTKTNAKTDKNASKNVKPTKTTAAKTTKTPVKTTTKTTPKPTTKSPSQTKPTVVKNQPVTTNAELPQIIVTSFSVPVRNEAKASAPAVSNIKLGTILKVTEKNPAWYRVQYVSGGKTSNGWVSANAVNDLNAADKKQIYRQIVERNYRPGMEFEAAAELYGFMSDISGEFDKSDASAEFELKRLLVLRGALKQIEFGKDKEAPYKDFLKNYDKSIVYNEPAGEYLVASNQFWDLHAKYQKSVVSDSIAWEAALNPLPGECEGYVNCYLFDMRMRFGEYLNLHPNGKYSAEALTNITNYLAPIVADAQQKAVYNGPIDVTDRAEFNNLVAELRTIVARLGFVEKEKTLQQLKQIAEAYR